MDVNMKWYVQMLDMMNDEMENTYTRKQDHAKTLMTCIFILQIRATKIKIVYKYEQYEENIP